jgi:hypothetical protein
MRIADIRNRLKAGDRLFQTIERSVSTRLSA